MIASKSNSLVNSSIKSEPIAPVPLTQPSKEQNSADDEEKKKQLSKNGCIYIL